MKNTIAVTVGLRYRFQDFEIGTILECKGRPRSKSKCNRSRRDNVAWGSLTSNCL
jgi:hypothetical protein